MDFNIHRSLGTNPLWIQKDEGVFRAEYILAKIITVDVHVNDNKATSSLDCSQC